MKARSFLAFVILLTCAVAAHADFKIVVHSSNALDSITKDRAGDIFLKKVTRWDNGRTITPVDQAERNAVREQFSKSILKKEVPWVESYWQKMIFSGRATPPARLTSDSEVLEFVRNNSDAIGYVSETTPIPAGLRAVPVKE